jgi:hypothetical protein
MSGSGRNSPSGSSRQLDEAYLERRAGTRWLETGSGGMEILILDSRYPCACAGRKPCGRERVQAPSAERARGYLEWGVERYV